MEGRQTSGVKLLATYAVKVLLGKCFGYKRLTEGEKACGKRYYAYLVVDDPSDGFNQCGYVDAMSKEALDAFAEITYGTYQKVVGEEFGKTIPAIFTDEPQTKFVQPFKFRLFPREAVLPWTDDFAESYQKAFGADILDTLPELFFDVDTPTLYRTRYTYHAHRTERFATAFSDNLGERAAALGLHLTGHLMEEPTLDTQCKAVGETMRHYKNFGLPGIDMLCGRHEYTTAKQTESVVRQQGKEGMLCELYGVSRWVAEFGKFKEEGDWLACLGVTVRVPHLSYYSMRGEAKRDYPPSIFYQAPWYLKFKTLEDHFSRLNVALTRGKALNDVAVIHPIESYYLYLTAGKASKASAKKLNDEFLALTEWLLFGGYDFDFVSEALLPSQRGENPLAVGQCAYKTLVVPDLTTMRRSTLDYLKSFRAAGGNVIFLGEVPSMIEGAVSEEVKAFAAECNVLPFEKSCVLSALRPNAQFTLTSQKKEGGYLATLREDGESRWLFLTSPRQGFPYPMSVTVTNDRNVVEDVVTVALKGEWTVTEYDTMTGEIHPMPALYKEGETVVSKVAYNNDSLLLHYEKGAPITAEMQEKSPKESLKTVDLAGEAEYELDEPNVLLLDRAKWSTDGECFHCRSALDRVTVKARKALGLPPYRNNLQPWIMEPATKKTTLVLRFEFDSEVGAPAHFACEYDEYVLSVNGQMITAEPDGYYVDKAIRTIPITIEKGHNVIDLCIPMGGNDCVENCYLLGNFGVEISAWSARIVPLPERLTFRDLTEQKMPFYSGKITYKTTFESNGENAEISVNYASALMTVRVNDEEKDILFAPYKAVLPTKAGVNTVEFTAYAPRENAFGAVHIIRKFKRSDSPGWYHKTTLPWRVPGYVLDPGGILEPPTVTLLKNE